MLFREMELKDVSQVHKIECELFSDPWSLKSFQDEVMGENISFPFIVEENNKIIGYIVCWYYFNELHIGNIAVVQPQQGKGIGKFMLIKIFDLFNDYERAYLEVRENNKAAINLYKSFGFMTTFRKKKYYPNGEDALVMEKLNNQIIPRTNDGLV
jgi:ribosomal-protein-alanine N-acetyltransferase